ncbi:MAG: glutamate racemase [Janthinobacterium lividum]
MTFSGPALPSAEIGVFDSGLGGLSVLREIRRQIPNASVLYLADTANVPYGDKPIHIVRDLALQLTDHLVHAGARLILMASGTSTVAGLEAACRRYPHLPIVGTIEPGARAAVASSTGPIGILATNATVKSRAFTEAVQAIDSAREVIEIGCPKFVPLVETGRAGTQEAEIAAFEYLQPLHAAKVQSIILGCTHFPFLLEVLHHAVARIGDPAFCPLFVDPSEASVRSALALLPTLIKDTQEAGTVHFAATGDTEDFRHFASLLLDAPIDFVSTLTL